MQISAYCQKKRCPNLEWFSEGLSVESRWSVYGKALKKACDSLRNGATFKDVLIDTHAYLVEAYAKIFTEFEWQPEGYATDDIKKLRRFLVFLRNSKMKVIDANLPTTYVGEGGLVLEGRVSLVLKGGDDKTYLVVIRPGKCDRSVGGKSLATKVSGDLRLLVAKWSLEEKYPQIIPWCVYMTSPDDADGEVVENFTFAATKKTNMTVLPVASYYQEGVFQREKLEADIIAAAQIPEEKRCDDCDYACLCKAGNARLIGSTEQVAAMEEKPYELPPFTADQMKVVSHMGGPLLVCACAGSGKTAALVGRIANLVKNGVAPNTILAVTFTRDSADEMLKRCKCLFDSKGNPPKISTIHSFAMDILSGYGTEIDGTMKKALDDTTQQEIIDELLKKYDQIDGFKYEVKLGKFGLLKTVLRRIEELETMGVEAFKAKHPEVGAEFYDLARAYRKKIKDEGYLLYDEMVPLALKILREHDEILGVYRLSCQYIMVDEFQDVSPDQAEFIYLLAGDSKNLVVVGDDDQCVYRWRGADPSYMRNFPRLFNAPIVIFRENFRSTDSIVRAGRGVIEFNPDRIDKEIVSSSGKKGVEPQVIKSAAAADLRRVITEVTESGYRYGDVAVIARTNKALADYKENLGLPCTLARKFLRDDALFGFIRAVLNLAKDPDDAMSFALLCVPFGLQYEATAIAREGFTLDGVRGREKFKEVMSVLDDLLQNALSNPSPTEFIKRCTVRIFWDRTNAAKVMRDEFLLAYPKNGTLDDLRKWCKSRVEYQSETRVTERSVNAVTLVTNHDCKGLEYPIVLLVCDYSQPTPEERSLFYVGITRAREKLYIFDNPNNKSGFVEELMEKAGNE
ncbi:MAG: ATP-dependent helicase, partial [Lachnospiraceae bacterium]|nr:ATP-dependent helicase [Lachnospiraceae bacterium]